MRIVLDTNVFVAAMRSEGGASRAVLRAALTGRCRPIFGTTLWLEYEDVLGRPLWTGATSPGERSEILAALASVAEWVSVHYGWRPNLRDAGDNHLIELAIAGNADAIVTHNVRDLGAGELVWKQLRIWTPAQCLEELK
jgi:putative PIN family toxin of toxin-antitoxin system